MQEYSAKYAKHYSWGLSNVFLINPGLERTIPKAKKFARLLDVGCGHGDHSVFAKKKGYTYLGIDGSNAMLAIATQKYPKEKFILSGVTLISKLKLKEKYDVILCNMLFPSFKRLEDIAKTLKQLKPLLTPTGQLVVTVSHPCFDPYIQKGLMGRNDIQANFTSYFSGGSTYKVTPSGAPIPFTDHHRTLAEYFIIANQAKLYIAGVDECPPDLQLNKIDKIYYQKKALFPSYLTLTMRAL